MVSIAEMVFVTTKLNACLLQECVWLVGSASKYA